jgi:hypothetical protein
MPTPKSVETPNLEALIQLEADHTNANTERHPSGMHSRTTRVAKALMEYAALKRAVEDLRDENERLREDFRVMSLRADLWQERNTRFVSAFDGDLEERDADGGTSHAAEILSTFRAKAALADEIAEAFRETSTLWRWQEDWLERHAALGKDGA